MLVVDVIPDGISIEPDGVARCWWGAGDELYRPYHDREWGRPVADDRRLFEKLSLEGFMSGLSWLTILRKREHFRAAFANFEIETVAGFGTDDVDRLLADAGIVRHRGKITAVINNARRCGELQDEFGSLAAYAWSLRAGSNDAPRRARPRRADAAGDHAGVGGDEQGPAPSRLVVRRPDDGVLVHGGDGHRQRPPHRLLRAARGRSGARIVSQALTPNMSLARLVRSRTLAS